MKKVLKGFGYIYIIIMALITLFPFVYMIMASLMTFQETTSIPPIFFPANAQFANYGEALQEAPFARYFLNTLFTASCTTIGTLVSTILAAFALTMLDFRGKKWLKTGLISLMMVPFEVVIYTNFNTIARMGLLDTYAALILPFLASVFYIFYLHEYLANLPSAYYKAAKVDGCSDLRFIWEIMIPLAKPALFTMGILLFITGWNSFMWPILVTNTKDMRLISNGLSSFATESGTKVQLQMAASSMAVMPILLLYLIFRKQIIAGVAKSGVKG